VYTSVMRRESQLTGDFPIGSQEALEPSNEGAESIDGTLHTWEQVNDV